MLKEFYKKAQEIINRVQPNVQQRTKYDTFLYLKKQDIRIGLIEELQQSGYRLAPSGEGDGYHQLMQPSIPYSSGDCYGYISEEVSNQYGLM